MHIVVLTTKLNFVAAGASTEELDLKVRRLLELGHRVTVVTMFSVANKIPEPLPYPVVEEHMGAGQFSIQYNAYRVMHKYEKEADIFYIDGQVFLYGAGAYRLLGGKKPVTAHFNRELTAWPENVSSYFGTPQKPLRRKIKEYVRSEFERLFCIPLANYIDWFSFTNPYLQTTYKNFGLATSRSHVAGDAFEYKKFMAKFGVTEESYRARNKQGGPLTIYYSSRMAPGKGFDTLVAAFAKVKNKDNFKMILGGKGPEDDKVKELATSLGLDPYVTYTGWAPKPEHYERLRDVADIFVQPSQSGMDKTSYILLESMAFGIPSILPGGGGLEWDAKGAALYFKGGDTDDLARKIEQLGASHELRAQLSSNCYERLKDEEMDYHSQVAVWERKMLELVKAA